MESSEDIITARGPQHHQSQLWQQKDEFEIGGDCEAIPLPQTESIPQQNWTLACGWIPIVGRDIVACLFSRDWEVSVFLFFVKSISRKFFVKMHEFTKTQDRPYCLHLIIKGWYISVIIFG